MTILTIAPEPLSVKRVLRLHLEVGLGLLEHQGSRLRHAQLDGHVALVDRRDHELDGDLLRVDDRVGHWVDLGRDDVVKECTRV